MWTEHTFTFLWKLHVKLGNFSAKNRLKGRWRPPFWIINACFQHNMYRYNYIVICNIIKQVCVCLPSHLKKIIATSVASVEPGKSRERIGVDNLHQKGFAKKQFRQKNIWKKKGFAKKKEVLTIKKTVWWFSKLFNSLFSFIITITHASVCLGPFLF